ncbi:Mis6 domain-containing protein [Colletotrichum scovillei]|uniref:Mis6 domain-containing protein n=1 Tax=Colletotrichum scovillei TaxID=1209932 RepID=A0A9P7ULY3_9PEZI|nr:Mis6 domain-containing protein [Colletotrichum scovillei]KAG7076161.1 Mis6 domain-containing protein [Colletotrichum scovillei]KAG7083299.1 Mis6 domain-containing protein [Colletotrichum scovillei]
MASPTNDTSMNIDVDLDVDLLIGDVVEASKLPAKRRATSIKPTVEKVASYAFENGLLPDSLSELIDLLTRPNLLDQASLNTILKNLYPATRLSSDVVLRVVGCLGHGELKPSLVLQSNILKWLIMAYHVIEKPAILSQAYAVLFNLLDTATIRPQLCHLLALITRRKHVRPFRIQAVQTGNDPALTGLLRVFKDYYPEIIVSDALRGRASAFKHPDVEWRERLNEIQRDHSQRTAEAAGQPQNGFSVNHQALRARGNKSSNLPPVYTSEATETSVTLEEIDSADRLAQTVEKIELPNQLAAVLADPLLQKFVALKKDDTASKRVVHWINAVLEDVLNGNADDKSFAETMKMLEEYVARVKETPPVVLQFLTKLFPTWNGVDARDSILGILQYAPLVLYNVILKPLEKCLPPTAESQLALLKLYQNLLRRWTFVLNSLDQIPKDAPVSAFFAVMEHASIIALNVVQASPSAAVHGGVLDLYEQAAASISDPTLQPLLRIANPPAQLIYLLFFSHSLANVSRLCTVLAIYKKGFEMAMSRRQPTTYAPSYVNHFNGYLMDICNCLWRGKAFNDGDKNALGCLSAGPVTQRLRRYVEDLGMDLALPTLFGFSYSPLLSLQAIECIRDLEDRELAANDDAISTRHAGPVTSNSLARLADARGLRITWSEYRIIVLRALEGKGLGGIPSLMKNTMKVLMSSKSAT